MITLSDTSLDDLVGLSHKIGAADMDCAILGEGNSSADLGDGTFAVKGSGCCLGTMGPEHFVRLYREPIVALLEQDIPLDALQEHYRAALVDRHQLRRPSVETVFHAMALSLPDVSYVAHTHPTAVNALTCAPEWRALLAGRLCPDEAVVLGPDSVFVPYVDPGITLARCIRDEIDAYRVRWGSSPKVVYLQNHGLIALGGSATEAFNITVMAVKAARMRLGCLQAGGINPLPEAVVAHLLGRSDEHYRIQQLAAS
ncbi:MAG: class II aldolase/adducin family protein [Planctomycetota bacterium]|jgi:rhamnose utilization protein RhaD (predicted bifunctional aldolase and dehydrogenase)|nr:class II aldolase/adducin family protein [Planctomycetota bacterium]